MKFVKLNARDPATTIATYRLNKLVNLRSNSHPSNIPPPGSQWSVGFFLQKKVGGGDISEIWCSALNCPGTVCECPHMMTGRTALHMIGEQVTWPYPDDTHGRGLCPIGRRASQLCIPNDGQGPLPSVIYQSAILHSPVCAPWEQAIWELRKILVSLHLFCLIKVKIQIVSFKRRVSNFLSPSSVVHHVLQCHTRYYFVWILSSLVRDVGNVGFSKRLRVKCLVFDQSFRCLDKGAAARYSCENYGQLSLLAVLSVCFVCLFSGCLISPQTSDVRQLMCGSVLNRKVSTDRHKALKKIFGLPKTGRKCTF